MKGNLATILAVLLTFALTVVINLSTNKWYYGTPKKDYTTEFKDAGYMVTVVGVSYFVSCFLVNMF